MSFCVSAITMNRLLNEPEIKFNFRGYQRDPKLGKDTCNQKEAKKRKKESKKEKRKKERSKHRNEERALEQIALK